MPIKNTLPPVHGTLEEIVAHSYGASPLGQRVLSLADESGMREAIERGDSVLPDPVDAQKHFTRVDAEKAAAEAEGKHGKRSKAQD